MANHQQLNNLQAKPAFVLGNGQSRSNVNIAALNGYGMIYGCNALYREFSPDHLIAVDVKMVNEIISSGYHRTHNVWTNPNKGIKSKESINILNPHRGWSSGPTALWLAAQNNHQEIYILGFDYQGIKGRFNNIYADTFNYKKSSDPATYHGNWLSQTEKVIKEYRHIRFTRVVNQTDLVPDSLTKIGNLRHLNYEEFEKIFQKVVYLEQNDQKTTI